VKKEKGTPIDTGLRRRAEERLKGEKKEAGPSPAEQDALRMVHELEVHQIELELQNEELKQARGDLEKQVVKYSDLYNFAPIGYFTLDRAGAIREANLTGARLLKVERSLLVGRRLGSFLNRESRDIFDGCLRAMFEETAGPTCELALLTIGDPPRYVQIEGTPVEPDGGEVLHCRVVMIDVTRRTQAEEALQRSERRYHSLFKNMLDGFAYCKMLFDDQMRPVDFVYLEVNDAFGKLTGLKNVTGKKVTEVIPGIREVHPELFETYGRVALTGQPESFEIEFAPLGAWLAISVYSTEIEYFEVVFEDITERKRAEAVLSKAHRILIDAKSDVDHIVEQRTSELTKAYESLRIETDEHRQAEALLRQAHKMEAIGTLAGGIAHDFNNILAAIIGFSEIAIDKSPEGSPVRRHMERVFAAGIRGRELVKQILAFSRQAEQEKLPLKLASVVRETLKLLRASLPSTIDIRTNLQSEAGFVLADPTQMQQVIMNLCSNAAHAMRRTGGSISVELSGLSFSSAEDAPDPTMSPGSYARLSVADTGEGMSPEIMEHIFDPFFTTKAAGEGTGLGLSVVHGIVTSHEGRIGVSSEPDKGSTFTVYFPKLPGEKSRDSTDEGGSIPRGRERILFIDDEEDLAAMADEMLTDLGYRVTAKTGAREALALFRLNPSRFDLIITDVTMPEMTGEELVKEILALRADTPIIMCTGFSYLVDADTARAAGIKAFAMKPLTKKEIAMTVRKVLDGHSSL
jgi:PAS domain S-box-containing protein